MKKLASIFSILTLMGTSTFVNAQALSMLSNDSKIEITSGDDKENKSDKKEVTSDDKTIKKHKKKRDTATTSTESIKKEEADYLFITP